MELEWTHPPDLKIYKYEIFMSVDSPAGPYDRIGEKFVGISSFPNTVKFTVDGLASYRTYYFRIEGASQYHPYRYLFTYKGLAYHEGVTITP
ncbi:MAG: fibronectin type III domain-containing protein [Clostridiales bacterium]|jgi:hypothetical protein|nr:fibronectin type III domain-containing protein [Clostridiales bacterium]